jgi:hypothetical protein
MGRKRSRDSKERRSPTDTVAHFTDDFIEELGIPALPDGIPQRLEDALKARIEAFLYHLREAKKTEYVRPIEMRLVRDAHRAVLTAYELKVPGAQVYYATFRKAVEELGYERCEAGYRKVEPEV